MKIRRSLTALILSFGLLFLVMSLLSGSTVSIVQAAPSARPALAHPQPISETPLLTLTGKSTGEYFGNSVASVDDVNGDGYDDILIGAPDYFNNQGRAYLYLGNATGLAASPTLTLTGEAVGNQFGESVASAGDVNGDGFADVLVGASGYNNGSNSYQGRAYLYLGSIAGLSVTPTITLTGEAASNNFGYSVTSVGDVNDDGFADVLIGAYSYNSNQGRVYLYLGNTAGLTVTPALTLTGEAASNNFGGSVASAGDVNGDGFADVLVGATSYNGGQGRAYLYLGNTTGLTATPALTLTGEAADNYFGHSVASASDVNGDGFADVLVGAYGYNSFQGRAYLYLGNTTGLSATPALTLTGEAAFITFGSSVASAGDVNGDGFADVLVGAPVYNSNRGRAYLYLGSPTGLSATPILTLTGEADYSQFGYSVASGGDVNGDGYAEVLVGANWYNNYQGRAYLYGHIPSLAPRPTGVTPSINAVGVPLTNNISIAFDEPIDLTSVTTGTFVVHGSQSSMFTGTYSLSDLSHTVTLNPARTFFPGEVVRAVVTTGTLNITGTHMLTSTQWQFTAGPIASRCVGGFAQDTAISLTGVVGGSVAWGDYDNDGHLDILLAGNSDSGPVTQLWHNDGNGAFTQVPTSFAGVAGGSVAWGDYDNDGNLDTLLVGDAGAYGMTQVWHNNGDGTFTLTPTSLTAVGEGSAAWGDYDNDGNLDILLAGQVGQHDGSRTEIWHNDGAGVFTQIPTSFPGVYAGSVAWGDYDNDGRLDILLAGQTEGMSSDANVTQVWHNDGAGAFTQVSSLPGLIYGSVAWGDYNNDGYLDILLAGATSTTSGVTQVWRNTGTGAFTLIPASFPSIINSSVAWGDYDNDGFLDILLAGWASTGYVTQVWHNNGDETFTLVPTSLTGIIGGSAVWGDYDNDDHLDILLAGFTNSHNPVTQVWHNDDCADIPITGLVATNDSPTVISHSTTFQATITAGTNVTYVWSFADGTPTMIGNPITHTYAMTGTYIAIVTATNSVSVMTATTQAIVIPLYKMYLPMVMKD